ncbi:MULTISPECIES: hypothetical protein [unclassified Mesorhizobium]|nr:MULTISPECIES: hypothetical protein [unclassified Mesorhizobium]
MNRDIQAIENSLRIRLQLLAYTLEPAAQAQETKRPYDVFHNQLVLTNL